jgi:hypothetical protein
MNLVGRNPHATIALKKSSAADLAVKLDVVGMNTPVFVNLSTMTITASYGPLFGSPTMKSMLTVSNASGIRSLSISPSSPTVFYC